MKSVFRFLFVCLVCLYSMQAYAQKGKGQDCENSCFNTEVVNVNKLSETCSEYEWKISFTGRCSHALSHFTASIPCGQLKNVSNSENWKLVFGTDPTTGLTGFKIDDMPEFGNTSLKSLTVKFTVCADNSNCATQLKCWKPVIAYKASTCVDFDTLQIPCQTLKATLKKTDALCFGAATGSLAVEVQEGQEPYSFVWSTGATTQSVSNLNAGDYTVTVKDASGAEVNLTGTVSQPEKINISGVIQQATCSGKSDGSIDVTVSGGTSPYTYLWSKGETSEDLQALKAGTYIITVKDAKGCAQKGEFTVANSTQIIISASQQMPDCNQSNGSINISVSGGNAPYSFIWSNGTTTEDIQNLAAGFHKVTVTDNSGCSAEAIYNLKENNTLKLSANVTQTSCLDDSSGAIDLTVLGGVAPYTYSWSNSTSTEDITNLISGNYTVTVTDSNGCTASLRVFVSKKTFQIPSLVLQPTCSGASNGSVTLQTPVGGVAPYTYQWSTGATGNSITDLVPGTYSVTVTDATGCSRQLFFVISNPPTFSITAAVVNDHCNANGFFGIDLNVSGGKAPYSFEWSNGAITEDLVTVESGVYSVKVTDANGCTTSKTVVVESVPLTWYCLISQPTAAAVCGSTGNTLTTSIAGASSYAWSVQSSDGSWIITGGSSSAAIQYTAGAVNSTATFTLTINKDGCTQSCSYTMTTCQNTGGGVTDPGGEDPTGEDPGGENPGSDPGEGPGTGTCEECFNSAIKTVSKSSSCTTYEGTVGTDGNCRHDLSHWVIAIPCGNVSEYTNSEGWKMSVGTDPTTGLSGLKVDDISGFGSSAASFTVRFTVCSDNNCQPVLNAWAPKVAYKASTCVGYDNLTIISTTNSGLRISAFPNPFDEQLSVEWTANADEHLTIEMIDQFGNRTATVYNGEVEKGKTYTSAVNTSGMYSGIYYYRLISSQKTMYGKLVKN